MPTDVLEMWTLYDHPRDHPGKFVARKFDVGEGISQATGETLLADTLQALRAEMLARGLVCLSRDPNHDPVIIETWI